MSRLCRTMTRYSLTVAILVFVLFSRPAQAEWYVEAQGGATFDSRFSHLTGVTGSAAGFGFSQFGLQQSPLYGGKVGYYFDHPVWKWLGFEMEAYTATPNVRQQEMVADSHGNVSLGFTQGKHVQVTNWSPISVMARYQFGRLEPYVGAGLGVYFFHVSDAANGTSISSNANLGLIVKIGLRLMVTEHISVFGEWKYNQAPFNYDNLNFGQFQGIGQISGSGDGQYITHIAVGGIGWHF